MIFTGGCPANASFHCREYQTCKTNNRRSKKLKCLFYLFFQIAANSRIAVAHLAVFPSLLKQNQRRLEVGGTPEGKFTFEPQEPPKNYAAFAARNTPVMSIPNPY
jgi:hypothetical protein